MYNLFLPYQCEYINSQSQFEVVVKCRRNGITWAEAFRAIKTRHDLFSNNKVENYHYVAQREDVATRFIADVIRWGALFNAICAQAGQPPFVLLHRASTSRVPLANGSEILSFSSNIDGLRGRGGSLTIDEAAFSSYSFEEFEAVALPLVRTMGMNSKLRVISTHNGYGTWFNRLCDQVSSGAKPDWNLRRIDIYQSVAAGLALKYPGPHLKLLPDIESCNKLFISNLRASVTDLTWKQEYEALPIADGTLIVEPATYDHLATEPNTDRDLIKTEKFQGRLYVGIDCGINDLTVVWVIERLPDNKYRTRIVKTLKGVNAATQMDWLMDWLCHPQIAVVAIDQGVFGLTITHKLQQRYGTGKIKGYTFTRDVKHDLAEALRKYTSEGIVSMPKNRPLIKEDLCALQTVTTESGAYSYDGRSAHGHADCAWACALALHAADSIPPAIFGAI